MRFSSGFTIGLVALLMLAACSESKSEPPPTTEPIPAAEDSASQARLLTIRYWQAPSLANPYLSGGIKDRDAGAITLEPLAGYDPNGEIIPKLAAEIPTLENGGFSPDLTSITWRLKEGLKWSDGSEVTANDVAFTWMYCVNKETGCVALGAFTDVESVEPLDDLTVRITFDAPTPYPYDAFVGASTPVISQAQFADCIGAAAASCDEENAMPIGTGPYRITSFGEGVGAEYERNSHYREERPYFDRVLLEGGGEAISAARAAMETGEADYAWNLQVEPEILEEMQGAGLGKLVIAFGSDVERIVVNQTNPDPILGDDRSEYLEGGNPHPFLTFAPISQAMSMAIDRSIIADQLYGFAAEPTCNLIAGPQYYVSFANDACLSQDIEAANRLLDESGVLDSDGDGVREYNGTPLRVIYQTTVTPSGRTLRHWSVTGGHRSASQQNWCNTTPPSSLEETRPLTKRNRIADSLRTFRCTRLDPALNRSSTWQARHATVFQLRTITGPAPTYPARATGNMTNSSPSWPTLGLDPSARSWSSNSTTLECRIL